MTILIGENYGVATPCGRVLGYMGENRLRRLRVIHPHFENAVYILKLRYSDGVIYECEIRSGEMPVDGSLLRMEGEAEAQFFAYVIHENEDGTENICVFESEIFTVEIGGCIDGQAQAIPTYEQSRDMLEKLLAQFNSIAGKPIAVSFSTAPIAAAVTDAAQIPELSQI